MPKLRSLISAFIIAFGVINLGHASTITWGVVTDTTAASDISTAGSLVKAFNSGGASTTVNGVTFAQFATAGDDIYDSFDAQFPGLVGTNNVFDDQANLGVLDPLLSTANFLAPVGGGSTIIKLLGLTTGSQYDLQYFFTDQRGSIFSLPAGCVGCNDREVTLTSGSNSVTLEADPGNASTAPFGQFVIGSFIADNSFQEFIVSGPEVRQVNAWQLRTSEVPVPAAVWLFGTALVGFVGLSRRRKVA